MEIGVALFIVIVVIIAIWLIIEFKRTRHKIFAIFLIILILFSYISFRVVLAEKDIDYGSVDGIITAGKIYFSWLGSVFGNLKSITTYAIQMDWKGNESQEEKSE